MLVIHRSDGDYTLVFLGLISIFSAQDIAVAPAMNTPWTALLTDIPAMPVDLSQHNAFIPLPALAVLSLTGPESSKFLQGQATTDFREVEKGRVLRGGICSLKGRLLFSFIAIPDGENVALVLPADQLEAALTHLKKYAVFSKTKLVDERSSLAVLGLAGPSAGTYVAALAGAVPAPDAAVRGSEGVIAVRIAQEERYLLIVPSEKLAATWPDVTLPTAPESQWWAAEIQAGLATVFADKRDLFQPQELNFHAIEAVSYNKGCYTGQEVVARLYFRGKLKQRLYHLQGKQPQEKAGTAIFSEDKQVGDEVMSATVNGQIELLAVVKNTAAQAGRLLLGENGIPLVTQSLPYSLPADKEE